MESSTFSSIASEIYTSGRNFTGSIWSKEITKCAFRDFTKEFLASNSIYKNEFFLQYMNKKFGPKKDSGYNYALSFVCSVKNHLKHLNEADFIDKVLHQKEITKNIIKD